MITNPYSGQHWLKSRLKLIKSFNGREYCTTKKLSIITHVQPNPLHVGVSKHQHSHLKTKVSFIRDVLKIKGIVIQIYWFEHDLLYTDKITQLKDDFTPMNHENWFGPTMWLLTDKSSLEKVNLRLIDWLCIIN